MKKYLAKIYLILITLIIIIGLLFVINPSFNLTRKHEIPTLPSNVKLAWGFNLDSIRIDTLKVRPNQCLSDLLTNFGIDLGTIDQLAKNSGGVFDVRRIKSGNTYYLIRKKPTAVPTHLIYEESAVTYYIFELKDSLTVSKGFKEIDTIRSSFSGIIETSLWNSFVDRGADPTLAIELSDIFAWTVDFFGIQKGDRFKVIYDEHYVDGKFVGIGMIYAALFESVGEKIGAYFFELNGQVGYFDESGNSLRKAFLKAPLIFSRISSRFSSSRFHPVLKIRRPHFGVDYAAPTGTPVYSIGDGIISQKAHQSAGGGNYLTIKHNSVYSSQYMHLSKYAKGISEGTKVKQGQLIGFVGMTGLASGPHLDFRIFFNGSPVDPLKVKTPPIEPISVVNKSHFNAIRDSLNMILDEVTFPETSSSHLRK